MSRFKQKNADNPVAKGTIMQVTRQHAYACLAACMHSSGAAFTMLPYHCTHSHLTLWLNARKGLPLGARGPLCCCCCCCCCWKSARLCQRSIAASRTAADASNRRVIACIDCAVDRSKQFIDGFLLDLGIYQSKPENQSKSKDKLLRQTLAETLQFHSSGLRVTNLCVAVAVAMKQ